MKENCIGIDKGEKGRKGEYMRPTDKTKTQKWKEKGIDGTCAKA